mmetsp:Transcript_41694/g.77176  ORF Transcript_41694/g.77176 Transcript_41694/m.77176 type:complete len:365 (-) Transcript_41694:240-1334(-)
MVGSAYVWLLIIVETEAFFQDQSWEGRVHLENLVDCPRGIVRKPTSPTGQMDTTIRGDLLWSTEKQQLMPIAVTGGIEFDGFGSQYSSMITVYAWALANNVPFCHTPWAGDSHGLNNTRLFYVVGGDYFGPRALEATTSVMRIPLDYNSKQMSYDKARDDAREFYNKARPKRELPFYATKSNRAVGRTIAVHMRLGDLVGKLRASDPMMVAECVAHVAKVTAIQRVLIVSEGAPALFTELRAKLTQVHSLHVELYLDDDLEVAFDYLVQGDVFVYSQSEFAWSAGFLNKGRQFYRQFNPRAKNHHHFLKERNANQTSNQTGTPKQGRCDNKLCMLPIGQNFSIGAEDCSRWSHSPSKKKQGHLP